MFFSSSTASIQQRGFTLIELMVTISIMTLITGIVMAKQSAFDGAVILKSQAYEMALDIREAQVFGVSTGGVTHEYREAYGIYVNLNTSANEYILFQDASGTSNLRYNVGEQVGEIYTIDSRFEIAQICTVVSNVTDCSARQASIAFARPDFDARIWTNTVPLNGTDRLEFVIQSKKDPTFFKTVVVDSSGQISVQ